MKNKLFNSLFILLLVFTFACGENSTEPPLEVPGERGDIISSNLLFEYNVDLIKAFFQSYLDEANVDIAPIYSVRVYKIVYKTIDPKGELIEASGSVYIPVGQDNLSILSAHHGTKTKRTSVGSVNPLEAPEGILAGTLGYYGVEPDYLGFGSSEILHPYIHAKSSATCVIDFIRAAKKFAEQNSIQLNGQLFLAGYSEGGFVTMAAHKEIETNYSGEFTVTASAPMAGSYDMNLTVHTIIEQEVYNEPSFLAFLMVSYNDVYGWNRLSDIFQSSYSSIVLGLYDGSKTTDEINGFLTNKVSELFKPEFISNFLAGNDAQFNSALDENTLLDWSPSAPIRLFHGTADEYVPYQNSVEAQQTLTANGGTSIELIPIEGGTHATAAIPSLIGAALWFNEIRNASSTAKISNNILAVK